MATLAGSETTSMSNHSEVCAAEDVKTRHQPTKIDFLDNSGLVGLQRQVMREQDASTWLIWTMAPKSDQNQSMDQTVRISSVDLKNTWKELSDEYTEEYEQCIENIMMSAERLELKV
ncbi:hypothetical protein K1719_009743 [Acacia pycnantha]|nr:hypothetical protein K1719_009743 [Acacia pycnantha]